MTQPSPAPYRAAAAVTLAVLAGYGLTLAPTVTFWDAGEFIAAAHSLGIPHPPGTPLYIFLLNVWARVVPFATFAVATNLFSALSEEIEEGRALYKSRVTAEIFNMGIYDRALVDMLLKDRGQVRSRIW